MVEIPGDIAVEEFHRRAEIHAGEAHDQRRQRHAMSRRRRKFCCKRKIRMIVAGQGVLYAEATDELIELAELAQIPVYDTAGR